MVLHTNGSSRAIPMGYDDQMTNLKYSAQNVITRKVIEILRGIVVKVNEGDKEDTRPFTMETLNNIINVVLNECLGSDEEDFVFNIQTVNISIHRSSKQILLNVLLAMIKGRLMLTDSDNQSNSKTVVDINGLIQKGRNMLSYSHSLSVATIKNIIANPGYTLLSATSLLQSSFGNLNQF